MSLKTRICRRFYVFRESSDPYISGDGIRKLIKTRIEGKKTSFRKGIGRLVFCEGDHVEAFLRYKRNNNDAKFILVSGNSDRNFSEEFKELLPDSLVHWFGQNILFANERVSPLPIGLENRYYNGSGNVEQINFIKSLRKKKDTGIFYSFNVETNKKEREPALAVAKKHPLGSGNERRVPVREFQTRMASFKFTLSPPGNGFDCHRTWEALYLGSIPIVKKSSWSDYLISLGIPMLPVAAWDEIAAFDKEFLDDWYEKYRPGLASPALFLPFWKSMIEAKTEQILKQE